MTPVLFNRSRRNLARWFTLSMGSILITFAGALFYLEATDELEEMDRLLYQKSRVMTAAVQYEFQNNQWQVDLDKVPLLGKKPPLVESELVYARWYNAKGQLVQFFGSPPPEQSTIVAGFKTLKPDQQRGWARPESSWLRQVTLPVQENERVIGYLQLAGPLTATRTSLDHLRLWMALAVPAALGTIAITGWYLGGLAMQPVRQAYEQLQRFTANASHELRAPLAATLSNAQVGLLAQDEAQQRLRLEKIVEITKSMSALVGQLLLLARQEGQLPPEACKPVDLTQLLQNLVTSYVSEFTSHQLQLTPQLPLYPVRVWGELDLLRQAIANLLSNALKYTPAGGKVQVRLLQEDRRAIIQIADNGEGIATQDLPHIFEQFYRGNRKRQRQTGGFGLGLAIAQQITEAHGGHLGVRSAEGTGTTFEINLPLG